MVPFLVVHVIAMCWGL